MGAVADGQLEGINAGATIAVRVGVGVGAALGVGGLILFSHICKLFFSFSFLIFNSIIFSISLSNLNMQLWN